MVGSFGNLSLQSHGIFILAHISNLLFYKALFFLLKEKRLVAKEKLLEMEEEMAEATAQLKAREAEKTEKVSSVR